MSSVATEDWQQKTFLLLPHKKCLLLQKTMFLLLPQRTCCLLPKDTCLLLQQKNFLLWPKEDMFSATGFLLLVHFFGVVVLYPRRSCCHVQSQLLNHYSWGRTFFAAPMSKNSIWGSISLLILRPSGLVCPGYQGGCLIGVSRLSKWLLQHGIHHKVSDKRFFFPARITTKSRSA